MIINERNQPEQGDCQMFEKDKITDLGGMLESWIHNEVQGYSCLLQYLYQPLACINELLSMK